MICERNIINSWRNAKYPVFCMSYSEKEPLLIARSEPLHNVQILIRQCTSRLGYYIKQRNKAY